MPTCTKTCAKAACKPLQRILREFWRDKLTNVPFTAARRGDASTAVTCGRNQGLILHPWRVRLSFR